MLSPALQQFKKRGLALIFDDSGTLPHGLLIAAAQDIRPETVNEMLTLGGGLLSVVVSPERAQTLELQRMGPQRQFIVQQAHDNSDYCVSVEAREGVSTGISVADRTATVRVLGERQPTARKLVSPGHIFPFIARAGGVLEKNSLREAALDFVRCSGFTDAALCSDLLDRSGAFMSTADQQQLAQQNGLPTCSLSQMTRHRLENENLVQCLAQTQIPTQSAGQLKSFIYRSQIHDGEHLALVKGDLDPNKPILTRVQPEFTFGDVFGGSNPPTRHVIQRSLKAIAENGSGVLVYLRRPQGGELRAQVLDWQNRFQRRPGALMREYGVGAQILRHLGVRKIELLTNSQNRLVGVTSFGVEIVSTRPIPQG